MSGPVIRNPTPAWLDPANASVFDSPWTKLARTLGHVIGADDPASQVLGLATTRVPGAADLEAKAIALYTQRGGGDSLARMAQAMKDAGIKLPGKSSAEKTAASAYVKRLMGESAVETRIDPTSPFAAFKRQGQLEALREPPK